jgi:tyrosine-protein phosphatase SIW14
MRSRSVRKYLQPVVVAVVLLTGLGSMSGLQQAESSRVSPSPANKSIARKLNLRGVPNFGEVTDQLYRGGQPTDEGLRLLAERGVGVVIDLRGGGEHEREQVTKLGMQYLSIPWHCYSPQDRQFAEFLRVLREHPNQKVFVHCRLGVDRTGMMIASYRMAEQGWSASEAAHEMAAFGFSPVHHMMCPGLASYESKFPTVIKTNPAFEGFSASVEPSK